jgi:hypothetical protein
MTRVSLGERLATLSQESAGLIDWGKARKPRRRLLAPRRDRAFSLLSAASQPAIVPMVTRMFRTHQDWWRGLQREQTMLVSFVAAAVQRYSRREMRCGE